jgi:hypothetical protein
MWERIIRVEVEVEQVKLVAHRPKISVHQLVDTGCRLLYQEPHDFMAVVAEVVFTIVVTVPTVARVAQAAVAPEKSTARDQVLPGPPTQAVAPGEAVMVAVALIQLMQPAPLADRA